MPAAWSAKNFIRCRPRRPLFLRTIEGSLRLAAPTTLPSVRSMWPRKQLDIGWTDLAFVLLQTAAPQGRPAASDVVGENWVSPEEAILSLSVRSGLDLLFA